MLINGYDWNAYTAQAAAQLAAQPPPLTWWQQSRQNRHQSRSIAGGLFLIASGGLHVACGLWEPTMERRDNRLDLLHVLVVMALHVAAMGGGCLGAALVHRWQTRSIYFLCGLLHCCGNALFIGLPTSQWALLGGRLLVGLAHGACYVCLIQHAGDNTAKEVRGRLCASIGCTLTLSTVAYLALALGNGYAWHFTDAYGDRPAATTLTFVSYACLGTAALALALVGMLLVACWSIESVLHLMLRVPADGDAAAIEALQRLRDQPVLTHALHAELMELKQMCVDEARLSAIIFRNGNMRPLMLLGGLRLLHALTDNALLNSLQMPGSELAYRPHAGPAAMAFGGKFVWLLFVPLILCGVRLLAATVSTLCADRLRRRWVVVQSFGGGCVVLLIAIVSTTLITRPHQFVIMYVILLAKMQAFAGWSADTVAHVMAAEAFGVRKKAWSVAAATAFENGAQLVAFAMYFTLSFGLWTSTVLMYVLGVKMVVLAGVLFWHMPETVGLGLAQCRNKFRGVAAALGTPVYSRAYLGDLQRQQAYKISVY